MQEKEIFDFIEKGTPHQQRLQSHLFYFRRIYVKGNYFEVKQYLLSLKTNYTSNDKENKQKLHKNTV